MLLGTMFSILSAHVSVASLLNGHVQASQPRSQERTLGTRLQPSLLKFKTKLAQTWIEKDK